ncbi:SubName: Full=Uncharacterized protein {ECO:0000313/EMBL:CCA71184.1} [Serendipita indica DSM 11827]|uniref:Uncharacterized protein n=1 Tax=Serendipita indica (strain DSM 11827) TaxID=1109443 RepID=G4TIP1_SERID|nr:SubName: Full=Uncharacterized protein {ECO:0000313/EMBL:CCA71184.1} [Serendipita indica DSM 11827]CCA71184.1 hypothetical protein PIIN_05120 [Serendipita indica DSM 11827]
MEQEIHRIWLLVSELSEQLNQNNRVAADLQAQIHTLKEQADATSKSTKLSRYNTDISNELFHSELERSTVAQIIENQGLLQENRQLTALMTEYEQTLETIMTKFRHYTAPAIEKEVALRRHYEGILAASEDQQSTQTYNLHALSQSLQQLQVLLQMALKNEQGVGLDSLDEISSLQANSLEIEPASATAMDTTSNELPEEGVNWAVEREVEIARLEKENEELRRQLGILEGPDDKESEREMSPFSSQRHSRASSTPFGSGFTTSSIQNSQPSSLGPNPFSPAYPGAQGYNPPPSFQQERKFNPPPRGGPIGPPPPQIAPRNKFPESNLGGRQQPAFPNFFRGAPPARGDRLDLAGGQPPLL